MDQKKSKNNKGKNQLSTLNSKINFPHKTTKKIVEDIIITNNQLKVNNSNKSNNIINVVKQNQKDKKSPIQSTLKNEKQNTDKNILLYTKTIENSINIFNDNDNNLKKCRQKKIKTNIYKIAANNKFIRTFSGCGKKRKCSLNSKGTFNTSENKGKKNDVLNFSKDKDKYNIRENLLSNDIEVIEEFNNSNINNYSSNKNTKFNTILAMNNYQQKDKDKYIKKINKEELKSNKKKKKINNSKHNILKPKYNLKFKDEISINDNKTEIINNNLKTQDKSSKNLYGKKIINKINTIPNNINSTIDESINSDKKNIKMHKIDSFKQKNKNNNMINNAEKGIVEEEEKQNQNQINISVEITDNKNTINNISYKSNYLIDNYFNNNKQTSDLINFENKRIYKVNNCLKKSLNKIMNIKQKENSDKTNLNDNKNINNFSKSKKGKSSNIKEIKINKINNNTNSSKKGIINIRTVSSIQNLKNENNSYNKYIKINKFNTNYFNDKYSTMSNRKKVELNSINGKKNYNNIKYSLIRNIKSQLTEENIFNNLLFILNIISNWGNKKHLGITEIEIFDINNQKIKIKECKVEGGNSEHTERLFNDKIYTINENDMFLLDINNNNNSKNVLNIKLYFYIYNYINLESINNINIWNYNGLELNKSIKKIELLTKDEDVIYHGIVPKGEYNTKCFHPYKIRINKNLLLKRNKNKIYKNTHLLYNSDKYELFPSFDLNSLSCNNSIINKNSKKKIKIKNANFTLMKLSSLNNSRLVNRLNFIKVKTSRSCHKDKNSYSFINNVFKRKINFSENKNKNYMENKFNSTKKYKNHSFLSENQKNYKFRGNSEIKKWKYENNLNYSISNTNLENNNSLKNIKSFESFNKKDINNFQTINITRSNNKLNKKIKNSKQKNNNIITKNKIKYIHFKKIKIRILTNYGNTHMVGLTGLNLIDKDNKIIDIKCAEAVGAIPKDLKTIYSNKNEYRIFENLFNDENNTINENFMWLTLLVPNPFIEICFKEKMSLSKIEIWNYNDPLGLDKGAKDIEIIFDDDHRKHYNIMLWKGLGIDYYDYYQKIEFGNLENKSNIDYLKLKNININNNKKKLPIGFVFKLIFISNFGDKEMISLKKFELYNEKNNLLTNYTIINDTLNENYLVKNSSKNIIKNNNNNEKIKNFFYYHRLFDFKKDEDSICNNLLFICFNDIVQIKYIKLENTSSEKLKYTTTKYMQIYCDDILIFEGELKQKGENIILFEEKEIKKFNNVININKKKEKNKFVEKIKGDVYRLVNIGS